MEILFYSLGKTTTTTKQQKTTTAKNNNNTTIRELAWCLVVRQSIMQYK